MREKIRRLFVPHEGNNFRPTFLERISMGIMLMLALLSFTIANIQALFWIHSDVLISTVLPSIIVDLTNEERSEKTLGVLSRSPVLDTAARMKAEHMAKNEYFAHYSPDGVSPWYWFDAVSYEFFHAGENLAVHFTDSSDVVEAWMLSSTHRENILNENYTEIGVGTAKGEYRGYPTVYVVQLFGTPQSEVTVSTGNGNTTQFLGSNSTDPITLETISNTLPENGTESVAQASFETIAAEVGEEDIDDVARASSKRETATEPTYEETIIAYSDLATTSRSGVLTTSESSKGADNSSPAPKTGIVLRSATQPSLLLQTIYGILALLVVVALALSITIEWRRQHPIQVVYAGGMLAVMAVLLYMHIALTGGVLIV